MPYIKADVKNVFGKQTKCRCPRCGKSHKMLMDWREKWICPKFCPKCRDTVEGMSGAIDDSEYHKYAATHHSQGRQ